MLIALALYLILIRSLTYDEPLHPDRGTFAVIGHELLKGRNLYSDLWDHKALASM